MPSPGDLNGIHADELHITQYLEAKGEHSSKSGDAALIVLNSPVTELEHFRRLYDHASIRLCADGGANRVHDLLVNQSSKVSWKDALRLALPDIIHGDLDSLDKTVRGRYQELGVQISEDPDQYSTDFGKAVKLIVERIPDVQDVLVVGSLGGRVDQGIGLLHELYREQTLRHPGVRFWLFSESSVTTLLHEGTTKIYTPLSTALIERNIGILPLYGPAKISTKGLEWDVADWPTDMGGQVSTSNHIMEDQITITTDTEVLFTVEKVTNA